jgi:hypothetical protein
MASLPIVLGTGVIFAVADSSDDDHEASDELLSVFVDAAHRNPRLAYAGFVTSSGPVTFRRALHFSSMWP